MDKTIKIVRKSDAGNSSYVCGTKEERISLVWPLTCEAVSLGKKYDAEQRLQRHIVTIVRKGSQDAETLEGLEKKVSGTVTDD